MENGPIFNQKPLSSLPFSGGKNILFSGGTKINPPENGYPSLFFGLIFWGGPSLVNKNNLVKHKDADTV